MPFPLKKDFAISLAGYVVDEIYPLSGIVFGQMVG